VEKYESAGNAHETHERIKHIGTLRDLQQRPECIERIVRVAEVFWEDPEVDSKMENDEPYDESDDCSANKEIKEVPGEVVNVEAQPLGPDSKEQEEYETSHNEDQVNIHFQVALLNHEHVEASGADLLLSAHFNLLGLLSFRTVRVCIHILCRLDFPKYFQLHQGETKLHRVLNLLEVIELASLLNLLAHGEDFVFVSEDRKVQIRAFVVRSAESPSHLLALGSLDLLVEDSFAHLHVLFEEFDNLLGF